MRKTGHACFVVKYAISARIASTESPAPSATARKDVSTQLTLAPTAGSRAPSRVVSGEPARISGRYEAGIWNLLSCATAFCTVDAGSAA